MAEPASAASGTPEPGAALLPLVIRGILGGVLMGLANLVPGISGGTMLLAAGVYPGFIDGIAEVSTLRFRRRSIALLAAIIGSAGLAILLLAGVVREGVILHRWLMYSAFIGLTLGGIPLIWRLARPATPGLWGAAAVALCVMIAMASGSADSGGSGTSTALLFVSGLAGASAMILPGVSGGYLLLLLGQYETILGGIDQLKQGLVGGGGVDALSAAIGVVLPVGLGVVVGVVGVSNALRWLLRRYQKATLGALLGLLVGAVVGLWPFQEPRAPLPGEIFEGQVLTASEIEAIDPEDWPLRRFTPTPGEVGLALLLVGGGFGATLLIARVGDSPARLED